MSKNYNKYYNSNNASNEVKNDIFSNETKNEIFVTGMTVVEPEEELGETAVVEPTQESVEVEETETPKLLYGINNCTKLNVRTEPTKEAGVVCVLDPTSEFEIEELESDSEWVKVFLKDSEVGFCMKKYVAIR